MRRWILFQELDQHLSLLFAECGPSMFLDKGWNRSRVCLFKVLVHIFKWTLQRPGCKLSHRCLSGATHTNDYNRRIALGRSSDRFLGRGRGLDFVVVMVRGRTHVHVRSATAEL